METWFEARHIPGLTGGGADKRIEDAEAVFWGMVADVLAAPRPETDGEGAVVETRYQANPQGRISLRLRLGGLCDRSDRRSAFAYSLPPAYEWRVIEPLPDDEEWQVCRLERRVDFIDLPTKLIGFSEPQSGPAVSTVAQADAQARAVLNLDREDELARQIIMEPVSHGQLLTDRYCLPVFKGLTASPTSFSVVLEQMQRQAPCLISMTLAPVDPAQLDALSRLALFWSQLAPSLDEPLRQARLVSESASAQFYRLLSPERFLATLTIQVAARSADRARAVAMSCSARMGGAAAFQIRDPVPLKAGQIGRPRLDVPCPTWDASHRRRRHLRVTAELADQRIACDELEEHQLDQLALWPHVYTLAEASNLACLPTSDTAGLPGMETRLVSPFATNVITRADGGAELPADRIRIGLLPAAAPDSGTAQDSSVVGRWHSIAARDLTKHAAIFGGPGAGKTFVTMFILRELARLGVPFLIIEPVKFEYYDALSTIPGLPLRRINFEGTVQGRKSKDFMCFDPMRLQNGVSVARHASNLLSCFEAAFPLDPVLSLILAAGLRAYYTAPKPAGCGLSLFSRGGVNAHCKVMVETGQGPRETVHPSFHGFAGFFLNRFLPEVVPKGASPDSGKLSELHQLWYQLFKRRFDAVASGMIGVASQGADDLYLKDPSQYDPFEALLNGHVVLELDGIPDNSEKNLVIAFVATFLFERRQADALAERENKGGVEGDRLRHVTIIEEAHRLLSNQGAAPRVDFAGLGSQAKATQAFVEILAESRGLGEGIVIVEQIPGKLSPEIVKLTDTKVMLRLAAADDRRFLSDAMCLNADQQRFLPSLRAERGREVSMVVFEAQLDEPRLLALPLPEVREEPVHASLF